MGCPFFDEKEDLPVAREDPSSILPAWQEFCGFDREGQNGWFDIDAERGVEVLPGPYAV